MKLQDLLAFAILVAIVMVLLVAIGQVIWPRETPLMIDAAATGCPAPADQGPPPPPKQFPIPPHPFERRDLT